MRTLMRAVVMAALLALGACGGGSEDPPVAAHVVAAQAARASLDAPLAVAVTAPAIDPLTFLDWAQRTYPALFPGSPATSTVAPFTYRYYATTQLYLGVANSTVFALGAATGNQLVSLGPLAAFNCRIYPERCAGAPTAEAGGTYIAYATHGERYNLTLDFERRTYRFTNINGASYTASGTFTRSATERLYLFDGGPSPYSGFRFNRGVVVGSFDFGGGARPFVASSGFATTFAQAAGAYNNLGVTRQGDGTPDSAIYSSRIDADGTLYICNHGTIYFVALCPADALQVYALSVSGDQFTATPNSANITGGAFTFRVSTAGADRTYLMATINTTTGARFFRIGTPESADFPSGTAYGGTTLGEWGQSTFTSTAYASTGFTPEGRSVNASGGLTTLGLIGPTGMRSYRGAINGFAIQNSELAALVGGRGGAAAGYIQVGAK